MKAQKRVLLSGVEPTLIDFSRVPIPGLNAEKVMGVLNADKAKLSALGYDVQHCLVDLGATATAVVSKTLSENTFDCILIGAGIRTLPEQFSLFENLINLVHQSAPSAKLCFNTNPSDTAEAIQRWV